MSLLMDALKKAELAKRQGQGDGAGGALEAEVEGGLTLHPLDGPSSDQPEAGAGNAEAGTNLPPLPSHLEELDARFLAEAEQAAAARLKAVASVPLGPPLTDQAIIADTSSRASAAAEPRHAPSEQAAAHGRSAAQNLFTAKQVDKPPARKGFAIAVGIVTVLSVLAIGGYFWWQLQPKTALVASRTPPSRATAAVSTPAAVAPAPTPAATPLAPVAGMPRTESPAARAAEDKADEAAAAATKAPAHARRAPSGAASPEPDSPVRVTRAPLKINPALIRGFDAFNRGDLALAQIEYERAQKSDPRNTDALHGLAAIAVRQGRLDQAELLYRQITEADPHDAVAMAALINSRGQIDPNTAESRLKSLSAAQPELAAPHFALGNLYARHGRWGEAQQAYFRAYNAEPDNPDILYNLAISLEHLRQNKLAAQYYGQAIAAAQTRSAGFDKAQATARLNALQP